PYCIAPEGGCDGGGSPPEEEVLKDGIETSDGVDDGMSDIEGLGEEGIGAACDYHRCVKDSGYESSDVVLGHWDAPPDCLCSFELWDCASGSKACTWDPTTKDVHECCAARMLSNTMGSMLSLGAANSDSMRTSDANEGKRASCECSIKLDCEAGDVESCTEYATRCCDENDSECKCEYESRACSLAFQHSDSELHEYDIDPMEYCASASETCCPSEDIGGCRCDFFEPFCTSYPNAMGRPCKEARDNCCGSADCACDLYSHHVDFGGLEDDGPREFYCAQASQVELDRSKELEALREIYDGTGGDGWTIDEGWMTELDHCKWHGVSCGEEGYVTKIDLGGNNLDGGIPADSLSKFYELRSLDVSNNNLRGTMAGWNDKRELEDTSAFFGLRDLTFVDLSGNRLSGEADVLFAPALEYVNFSSNNFTSVDSFKGFKRSHATLRVCDVSHNQIRQEASELLKNVPANVEELSLSNNHLRGTLPFALETLAKLKAFRADRNALSGPLPDFSTAFPALAVLDLSHQRLAENDGDEADEGGVEGEKGFTGTLSSDLASLRFLERLSLAGNSLGGGVPKVFGNTPLLKVLDLSENFLTRSIPKELGKLGGDLEVINLSSNKLSGKIPAELGLLNDGVSVLLNGNPELMVPAPIDLCFFKNFDLGKNSSMCPLERNALKSIFDGAKGNEWTRHEHWSDPYRGHCTWYGVKCNEAGVTTELNLHNNGLSGTLSESVANLTSIEILDLSDNDIKGSIPTEIGLITNLKRLRLNHNAFKGDETSFGNLKHLQLIQLHGNRLSGTIAKLGYDFPNSSSYIADCGNPSLFEEPLVCEECTSCCNSAGDCYPQEESQIQQAGFENYIQFSFVFFAGIFALAFALALMVYVVDRYRHRNMSRVLRRQQSLLKVVKDKKYALETMGDDSVYQFFLGKSITGWIIVLATMACQIGMLFVFVEGSEVNLADDRVDLVYTYKCPRDQEECDNTSDLTWRGWLVFAILMVAHLAKDVINGTKMIILSAKARHSAWQRARFFTGGTLLVAVTAFTLYVSTIYNGAIATSNTEIVMNSVVILFIDDMDEMLLEIMMVLNPRWVDMMSLDVPDDSAAGPSVDKTDEEDGGCVRSSMRGQKDLEFHHEDPDCEMQSLKKEVRILRRTMYMVLNKGGHSGLKEQYHQNLESQEQAPNPSEVQSLQREVRILHKTMDMLLEQKAETTRRQSCQY
ncbi:hypothetical protein ACHAWF_017845, partial [Thalassiosira exigua]